MIKVFTFGLSKIEMADCPSTGAMAADKDLVNMGYTNENSAQLTMEVPDSTEFNAEEVEDPVLIIKKAKSVTVEWDIMNPSPDDMVRLMGGTASKSEASLSDNDQWEPPIDEPTIEQCLRVTPKQGLGISIPRADITATFGGTYSKSELVLLHVSAKVMAPTASTIKRFKMFKV